MKRFFGFIQKELYHIFRDKRSLLILFGMPVAQLLLFGFVIKNELRQAPIAVLDHAKDEVTRELTNKMVSSGYFVLAEKLESNQEIHEAFQQGRVNQVIVFESNFARKLEKEGVAQVSLIADASNPNLANLVTGYTSGIMQDYLRDYNKGRTGGRVQIDSRVRMLYNEELRDVYMFVPGIMAMILMLVSAMMTSISIAREKELGTMEILLVSPLRPAQIILGKVMPYLGLSFINAFSIVAIGVWVFGMPIEGSLTLLMAASLLFILLALSLGILISTVTDTQQAAMLISMLGLLLPTILLSGFIFPIENMPDILQWISYLMPPRYFISILKTIMLKGMGLFYIWQETLILIAMTAVFIMLSVRKFKIRLE